MKANSFILILVLFFLCVRISAQDENNVDSTHFFTIGKQKFDSCKYDTAVTYFVLAQKYDIIKKNIDTLLSYSKQCHTLTKEANSLRENKKYEEALQLYKKIYSINRHDRYAKDYINDINNRINCFNINVSAGDKDFDNGDYSAAIIHYTLSKKCELSKDTIRIENMLKKAKYCLEESRKADSLFTGKAAMVEKAYYLYKNISDTNPNDKHCISRIKSAADKIPLRSFCTLSYSYQYYCPYGLSLSYYNNKKLGFAIKFCFDRRINELQYSTMLGISRSYLIGPLNIAPVLGIGYGQYADYWFENGESAHQSSYPEGMQFEGSISLTLKKFEIIRSNFDLEKINKLSINLGFVLPAFIYSSDLKYRPLFTFGIGINFYIKR
jgi:tetratricopeptide (TPR) repeat protein